MFVDVVCLRRDGNKLAPEAVRAASPVRARLTIDTVVMPSLDGAPVRSAERAQLWPPDAARERGPLGTLDFAAVSRTGGASLLVVGVEPAGSGPARPQAWWCRIVLPGTAAAASEMHPEDLHAWLPTGPGVLTAAGDSTS